MSFYKEEGVMLQNDDKLQASPRVQERYLATVQYLLGKGKQCYLHDFVDIFMELLNNNQTSVLKCMSSIHPMVLYYCCYQHEVCLKCLSAIGFFLCICSFPSHVFCFVQLLLLLFGHS